MLKKEQIKFLKNQHCKKVSNVVFKNCRSGEVCKLKSIKKILIGLSCIYWNLNFLISCSDTFGPSFCINLKDYLIFMIKHQENHNTFA